jgi:hypothetical protein
MTDTETFRKEIQQFRREFREAFEKTYTQARIWGSAKMPEKFGGKTIRFEVAHIGLGMKDILKLQKTELKP